jgi:hypothetical protein
MLPRAPYGSVASMPERDRVMRRREQQRAINATATGKRLRYSRKIKSNFGISFARYSEMLVKQSGRCAVGLCNRPLVHEKDGVDHCHKTGRVRGLLCHICNASLRNHSPELLRSMADYVEQSENK